MKDDIICVTLRESVAWRWMADALDMASIRADGPTFIGAVQCNAPCFICQQPAVYAWKSSGLALCEKHYQQGKSLELLK